MGKHVGRTICVAWNTVFKDGWLDRLQSLVTIVAIIVGGYWTYRLFVMKRELRAHLNINSAVVSKIISPGVVLIHLSMSVQNTGEGLVTLGDADIRVQQVSPLAHSLQKSLNEGKQLVPKGQNIVPWPLVCRYLAKLDMVWPAPQFPTSYK